MPGVEDYNRAIRQLDAGLPNSAAVIRRWGAWGEACKAAKNEAVSWTPTQRSYVRATAGRRHKTPEQQLDGVRTWLAEEPASTTIPDYEEWVTWYNEHEPEIPAATYSRLKPVSVLGWSWILRVARNEMSLAEAQSERLDELKAGSGALGIVGWEVIALVHGVSHGTVRFLVQAQGFPVPVLIIERNLPTRGWFINDVEAHHAGEPFPVRVFNELRPRVMLSREISEVLGEALLTVQNAAKRRPLSLPPIGGRLAGTYYWLRADVDTWAAEHPDRIHGTFS